MTPYFEWFVSYTKNLTKDKVYLGDNSSHDIERTRDCYDYTR